jgi:quinol-cytochrome oxidoreductase complex cytochrome b subunit
MVQFVIELLTGILISLVYRENNPYQTDRLLHFGWPRLFQASHYWGSALVIVESFALLTIFCWKGIAGKPYRSAFWSTVLVFGASLGFQLTGNALPFDRHGVQTAVIESSIAARVPGLGDRIRENLLGGSQFSIETVHRWYLLHLGLTIVALSAIAFALIGRSVYAKKPPRLWIGIVSCPTILAGLLVASPLGSQATAIDFGAFSDRASWYTWPLHGSLVMTSKIGPSFGWIGAMLIPTIGALFLVTLPLWNSKQVKLVGRTGIVLLIGFFSVAAIGYGGEFDSLIGKRDPEEAKMASTTGVQKINPGLSLQGRADFNSAGCAGCHGVDGLKGGAGPSLRNVQKQHPDSLYYQRYVKNPQAIDPQSTMPANPQISQKQLVAIGEYLRSPK